MSNLLSTLLLYFLIISILNYIYKYTAIAVNRLNNNACNNIIEFT